MAKKIAQGDPALALDYFVSGFYTYRSQLFAPFKGIGVNVVSFRDPVIDGQNFELTDKFEWQRRPGFSIYCSQPLAPLEIVRQFYDRRDLNGTVTDFVDTSARVATFTPTAVATLFNKNTTSQCFITSVGNKSYFSDGASEDLNTWDGTAVNPWGLAAPTVTPSLSGMGFWEPDTQFSLGDTILDPNGNVESVTAILIPNGGFESPQNATTSALGGSLSLTWTLNPVVGGYQVVEGYAHIQQASGAASFSSTTASVTLPAAITVGNVLIVTIGSASLNFLPSVLSVVDNLGNTYSLQATGNGTYHGGGGQNYSQTQWVYSAPITTGGVCTVTVTENDVSFQVGVHEVQGIGATATTTATNFAVNAGPAFNTGTVSYSGTKFVFSSLIMNNQVGSATQPAGYTDGIFEFGNSGYLEDVYEGIATSASPTWSIPGPSYIVQGISVAFPITSLTTGYTPYLFLYNFDAAVPSGATIVGLVLTLPAYNAGAGGTIVDQSVKLVIGGSATGTDHASATAWSNSGYLTRIYGTPTDTWGTSITPAQANATGTGGFGFMISADITSVAGGSVVPTVGFNAPQAPTVTIYFKQTNGSGGPGISGQNQPVWPTNVNTSVNDGGLAWTNYGPIETWFPATGFTTPVVILDVNGNLQLSNYVANPILAWNSGTTYAVGNVVYFGGNFWVAIQASTNVVPAIDYATTGSGITQPFWALTTTPLVTGLNAPVWNTTIGGSTTDGSFTWKNIGQGTGLAFMGYSYVYAFRTIYDHLTTASPVSNNTGAILGPLNASITAFSITSNVITFTGNNNFVPNNVFQVRGLAIGTYLNNENFTVISAVPSASFPLTSVSVTSNVLTVTAANNLTAGQSVTFTGVGTATFLNGTTVTVISTGLSSSQFEANLTHANYGPTADTGTVEVIGSWTANFTHANVSSTLDNGAAIPLIATISGLGTASPLCNSVATITAVSVEADIVTFIASNNFQPGIWVTISGLTGASFLNNQQVQVISVDQPVGTQNTQFTAFFATPNYSLTTDSGTATFNAVEIYRTSDGGGTYLFSGAVTNPGFNKVWTYDDFVVDADLDVLLVAPLSHLNDPPPGAPGSTVTTAVGTITAYWQGRIWMAVGNYVYFDAGPDCVNGIPEESWPPAYRFQYAGPVLGLQPTADGIGLLVYLADRVNVILGGPETISFYSPDALSRFGISSPNALFRDGSVIGQFTTQRRYVQLLGAEKDETDQHIADYVTTNFAAASTYATMHRDGLDVGVFLSNGVDRILRYGSNIGAWSVPYFPAFGAGALRSIETSVGHYSLMAASPNGSVAGGAGPLNPSSGTSIGSGTAWTNPSNITIGNPTSYAVLMFTTAGTSQTLRAADYLNQNIPATAVVQGVTLSLVGNQTVTASTLNVTVTPTGAGAGAETHTFQFGSTNTTKVFGNSTDLWGMPWSQPSGAAGIGFDITTTYTGANPITTGAYVFDVNTSAFGNSSTATVGPLTPASAGEIAMIIGTTSSGVIAQQTGWSTIDNSTAGGHTLGIFAQIQPTAAPFTFSASLGSSLRWVGQLTFFRTITTSFTANITQLAVDNSNIVTVTCNNSFQVGTIATCSGVTTLSSINGVPLTVLTSSPTQFTAFYLHAQYTAAPDTGTATDVGIVQSVAHTPGNVGTDSITLPNPVTPGNIVLAVVQGIDSGGFGTGHASITGFSGSDIAPSTWTIFNAEEGVANFPESNWAYVQSVTSGSTVQINVQNSLIGCRWIVLELSGGVFIPQPVVSISEAQVVIAYQNPGNYLYVRDLSSWGDGGTLGANNGTPYATANIVLGSISLTPLGGELMPLQHVVGYFDAVGTLNDGGPSIPDIWILPNEFQPSTAVPWVQLPEVTSEPPTGVNNPSQSLLALRYPVSMMNMGYASQLIHHLQVKIQFEPENQPNTIKAIAFKEDQS